MLLVVSNHASDLHDTGPGHPERRARTQVAREGLFEAGLADLVIEEEARQATLEEVGRVHDDAYLEGGYDLDALKASAGAAAAAVLGQRYRPEKASAGGPGADLVPLLAQRRRQAVEAGA